jgi:hypothetical protein
VDDFNGYYDEPGLFFGASDTFAKWGGYIQFLDIYSSDYSSGCRLEGRYDYNDGYYRGKYDKFTNCGGAGGTDAYVLSAVSTADQGAYIILLLVQVPKGDTATPADDLRLVYRRRFLNITVKTNRGSRCLLPRFYLPNPLSP